MRKSVRQSLSNMDIDWYDPSQDKRAEGCHQITPDELLTLKPMLDWLSPLHRDIFYFIWVAGFSQSQTARILGIRQPEVSYATTSIPDYLDRIQQRFNLMPKFMWWIEHRQAWYLPRQVEAFVTYYYVGSIETRGLTKDGGLANGVLSLRAAMHLRRDRIGVKLIDQTYGKKLKRGDCNPEAVIPSVVARAVKNRKNGRARVVARRLLNKQNCPADGQKEISPA